MNIQKEKWKDIAGYKGYYQISNRGAVRSKNRFIPLLGGGSRFVAGRTIRFKVNSDGYRFVTLSLDGKQKTCYIHRLVALTFIANPEDKSDVNHINGMKSNNCVENLEWNTHAENLLHAYQMGLCSTVGDCHHEARRVVDTITGIVYGTVREAAVAIGCNRSTLSNMLNGWNRNTSSIRFYEEEKGDA